MASKPISSPVPAAWYQTLAFLTLVAGLVGTATFFIYEATSSRRNRRLSREIMTGAAVSIFLDRDLSDVRKLSGRRRVLVE